MPGRGVCDQVLVSGGEQCDLQPPVFQIPPTHSLTAEQDHRADDARACKDLAHLRSRQEQAFGFLIAQAKLVKSRQEKAGGNFGCGIIAGGDKKIRRPIQFDLLHRKLCQPGPDLGLGLAEEVGGICDGGRSEMGEIPAGKLQTRGPLLHGLEWRAELKGFLFLDPVADAALFAKRPENAAPGVKEALAFRFRHTRFPAEGFQRFPVPGPARDGGEDMRRKVFLALGGNERIGFQGIHRAEKMGPPLVEEKRQVIRVDQVHGTPVRPGLYERFGLDFPAPDGKRVQGMGKILGLLRSRYRMG